MQIFFQFYPYPNYGTFTIAGESFDLMDGLFALALSPKKSSDFNSNQVYGVLNRRNERVLYFHSLASGTENAVALSVINNASIWESNVAAEPRAFQILGRRGVQAAGKLMIANANDENWGLFYSSSDGQKWKFVFCSDGSDCTRLLGLIYALHNRKHQNRLSKRCNFAVCEWHESYQELVWTRRAVGCHESIPGVKLNFTGLNANYIYFRFTL